MRRHLLPLAALAAAIPAMATAGGLPWVSNTAICPDLRAGAELVDVLGESDVLLLDATGFIGMEYRCSFQPALDLGAGDQTITTHTGYCEELGFLTPSLFTFRIERMETPRVTLYDGTETPTVFFACP